MAAAEGFIIFPLAIMLVLSFMAGALTPGGTITFILFGMSFNITLSSVLLLFAIVMFVAGALILGGIFLKLWQNETTTLLLFKVSVFSILWIFLAGIGGGYVRDIPYAGAFIYWGFTFMYGVGVALHVRGYGG